MARQLRPHLSRDGGVRRTAKGERSCSPFTRTPSGGGSSSSARRVASLGQRRCRRSARRAGGPGGLWCRRAVDVRRRVPGARRAAARDRVGPVPGVLRPRARAADRTAVGPRPQTVVAQRGRRPRDETTLDVQSRTGRTSSPSRPGTCGSRPTPTFHAWFAERRRSTSRGADVTAQGFVIAPIGGPVGVLTLLLRGVVCRVQLAAFELLGCAPAVACRLS